MTKYDMMQILLAEYPNGVSFDPMALRLMRHKISFDEELIGELKEDMFQLGNSLWFSLDMIAGYDVRMSIQTQAEEWLNECPCFSVKRLFDKYAGEIRNITTCEHFSVFFRQLGFSVEEYGNGGFYAFRTTSFLRECLESIANSIAKTMQDTDGIQALNDIEELLPYLTTDALEDIRTKFLPELHVEEIFGVPCWRSSEAVHLPEDFSEKVTEAIDTLVDLGRKVDTGHLEFALDLLYRISFRKVYSLTNRRVFISTCAKNYTGTINNNKDFSREFIRDWLTHNQHNQTPVDRDTHSKDNTLKRRHRGSNTRFDTLGVPVGAKLVFTKDCHIICTVINHINKVEYDSKPWTISALAKSLLNVSAANGFSYFSYGGEILFERRLRLERESRLSVDCDPKVSPLGASEEKYQPDRMNGMDHNNTLSIKNEMYEKKIDYKIDDRGRNIIGLEGHPLKPDTWRAFRRAGTDPCIAEWVQRVNRGERVEDIAEEYGYATCTVKNKISEFNLYFKVCDLNNIVPEGSADV